MSSLEALKEELQLMTDKKSDLERRLQTALLDRDQLAQQYEEACDRIAMLERHVREQVFIISKNTFYPLKTAVNNFHKFRNSNTTTRLPTWKDCREKTVHFQNDLELLPMEAR